MNPRHALLTPLVTCALAVACGPRPADTPTLIESPSPVALPARALPDFLAHLDQGELALVVTTAGVDVWVGDEHRAPLDACPYDGPTVCVLSVGGADPDPRQDARRLYNVLIEVKAADPSRVAVHIAAAPEISFALIVELMDLVRARRVNADPSDWFEHDATFWAAATRDDAPLFPEVALVIAEGE